MPRRGNIAKRDVLADPIYNSKTVSYTHLDVYKRQAMDGEVIEAGKPITMVNLDSDAIERTITFTPTAVKPLLVPHILGGQLAIELPSIAEKKAYIAKQLTEETWESELRLECPHKHYVNMTDVYKRQLPQPAQAQRPAALCGADFDRPRPRLWYG